MDYAYIARGDGNCCLCRQWARERWHIVVECEIVKELWQKLGLMVEPLCGNITIDSKEMAFGVTGSDKKTKLRNRLGFTLRSTIMTMRGLKLGDNETTIDQLWKIFLQNLKKNLIEEWYVAKLEGSVILFEAHTLVGGLLGQLTEGEVAWSPIFDEIRFHYYNIYD